MDKSEAVGSDGREKVEGDGRSKAEADERRLGSFENFLAIDP